ncbi:MAG: hypothetical protein E6I52_26175 [Chloroflexi bacterium]|nr:MAG: hypothetical protein E6I52_26175 [Chloroflexota bacterium]
MSIDRLPVGDGLRGPLTRRLQERFDQAVRGESARESWTTPVYSPMPVNGVVGHASVGDR